MNTSNEVIATDIGYIKRDLAEIKNKMENNYVTRDEFTPVRNIVYGMAGLILIGFVGAIISLVIKSHT